MLFDFNQQKLLFYELLQVDPVFYDFHIEVDKIFFSKTEILLFNVLKVSIARVCNLFTFMVYLKSVQFNENQFNLMNQNFANLNTIFLFQKWKSVYTFKSWLNIFF